MVSEAFVLQPGEGRSIDLGVFVMSVKATAESTDGAFTLLEATQPPQFGPPMHIHRDAAEAFYVLEGEYRIFIDDQEVGCPAGRSSTSRLVLFTAFASARCRAGN